MQVALTSLTRLNSALWATFGESSIYFTEWICEHYDNRRVNNNVSNEQNNSSTINTKQIKYACSQRSLVS